MAAYNPYNLTFNLGKKTASPTSGVTQWAGASDFASPASSSLSSAMSIAQAAGGAAPPSPTPAAGTATGTAATATGDTRSAALLKELRSKWAGSNTLSSADMDRLIAGGFSWADLTSESPSVRPTPVAESTWRPQATAFWQSYYARQPQVPQTGRWEGSLTPSPVPVPPKPVPAESQLAAQRQAVESTGGTWTEGRPGWMISDNSPTGILSEVRSVQPEYRNLLTTEQWNQLTDIAKQLKPGDTNYANLLAQQERLADQFLTALGITRPQRLYTGNFGWTP